MVTLVGKSMMSVVIPDDLTDAQIDGIRQIVHGGASTCLPSWSEGVTRKEDKIRSLSRRAAMIGSNDAAAIKRLIGDLREFSE